MAEAPIPMFLTCPYCGERHIDRGKFATKSHHTHACQACGMVWRPAIVPTVGVRFLPGFKDEDDADGSEPLPPGPAFIPAMNNNCGWTRTGQDCSICREWHDVPLGYIWRPATDGTMAGWVRPSGGDGGNGEH